MIKGYLLINVYFYVFILERIYATNLVLLFSFAVSPYKVTYIVALLAAIDIVRSSCILRVCLPLPVLLQEHL